MTCRFTVAAYCSYSSHMRPFWLYCLPCLPPSMDHQGPYLAPTRTVSNIPSSSCSYCCQEGPLTRESQARRRHLCKPGGGNGEAVRPYLISVESVTHYRPALERARKERQVHANQILQEPMLKCCSCRDRRCEAWRQHGSGGGDGLC